MAAIVKTVDGLALASVKAFNGLVAASLKTINGQDASTGGGGGSLAYVTTATNVTSGTTSTAAVTIGSTLSGGYVIVACRYWHGFADVAITGITFDGSAMTQIGNYNVDGTISRIAVYGLAIGNKAAGTYNAVATIDSATNNNVVAVVYQGVNQTTPLGTTATDLSYGDTGTATVTSATGEVVAAFTGWDSDAITYTDGAGQTQRANIARVAASTKDGATSVGMTFTLSGSTSFGIVAVPLKP